MTKSHQLAYACQFGALVANIIMILFYGPTSSLQILVMAAPFCLTEIFILESHRRMPKDQIYYRKSCWFGLADLLSVLVFFSLVILYTIQCLFGKDFGLSPNYIIGFYAYVLLRKIYIFKNYTYEK